MDRQWLDDILSGLWQCQRPQEDDAVKLLSEACNVLKQEPNVLQLKTPMTVCGDIHGQFYDLLELFSVGGRPPEQNFLFLGDYVDRGFYSVETFLLLIALKLRFPRKIFLLRGNHECASVTEDYGYQEEVSRKYGSDKVYLSCLETFNCLPLAAVLDDRVFCVHGGLSRDLETVAQISALDRFMEIPEKGLFSDLLWSDPDDIEGYQESPRGAGVIFGGEVTQEFLKRNNFSYMLRAHQLAVEGYKQMFDGLLYTVWSAPNYCYREGNVASVMELSSSDQTKFKIFSEAPASARGSIPEVQVPAYFM